MSEQFDSIMEGLNELTKYAKGDKSKVRSRIHEGSTRDGEICELKKLVSEFKTKTDIDGNA